ncbi:hypothetical protein Lal_00007524 [Lupinus albus]|nr:hypothetical protein Lal_00007524 [Lupinus albus]
MSSPLFLSSSLVSHYHYHHRIFYIPPTAPNPSLAFSNLIETKTISVNKKKESIEKKGYKTMKMSSLKKKKPYLDSFQASSSSL